MHPGLWPWGNYGSSGVFFFVPTAKKFRYDTRTHLSIGSAMTAQQFRKPQRLTITVSWVVFERLIERSQREGRSISNLSSFILERGLCDDPGTDPPPLQ